MQNVPLILQVPHHALSRMNALVVPTLGIHGVGTEYLQLSAFNLRPQNPDHAAIFIFKKLPHRGRKHQQRRTSMPEDQRVHVSTKFVAIAFVIFAVHLSADANAEVSYPIPLFVWGATGPS